MLNDLVKYIQENFWNVKIKRNSNDQLFKFFLLI
jgi:hypothetical protein